jgi:hypothetical protein
MNIENTPAANEAVFDKETQCHDACCRSEQLKASVEEAKDILYRGERPARSPIESVIGQYELLKGSYGAEAESAAEKGEAHKERVMRMLEKLTESELEILQLYCDAKNDSEELAEIIRTAHPWVEDRLKAANDDFPVEEAA